MRIAMLSSIAKSTPPRDHISYEQIVSLLTEGLVERGDEVTLFATGDSVTDAKLCAVSPEEYNDGSDIDSGALESLHISHLFEQADEFDLIHNHLGFLPLTYMGMTTTPVVTTIHGFSTPCISDIYKKYSGKTFYVSISNADRIPELDYIAAIPPGINLEHFSFQSGREEYLLFFGRIEKNSGAKKAIEIAKRIGMKLIITGSVYDQVFFENDVQPHVDGNRIKYVTIDEIKKMDDLFGSAYALLYPEQCDASYILPAIESMACGTPVIALNYGSIPELIVEGKTGFLISDPEGAVDAISRIPSINRRECRKHVEEHFTAARMVDDYRALYEHIVRQTTREEHRPWGYYKVLADETDYKVKQIVVYPGKRLSLQRHKHRAEHWYIVEGEAIVTRNEEKIYLKKGHYVDIPLTALHRIQNNGTGNMAFVEIQTGDYFGEDDIERLEDDFGRL